MSTIKDKFYFNFNGKNSRDFGIIAVDLGSSLYEEIFAPTRTINQTETVKGNRFIFHNVKEEPRSFDLNLAFEDSFDDTLLDEIGQWLFTTNYYKPLYFEGQEERVMFALITGSSSLFHNGMNRGYFTVTVQTNSPYLFSQMKTDSLTTSESETLLIENRGQLEVYPEFSIRKIGQGDLTFGMNGRRLQIVNLTDGEELYIDTLREIIKTDVIGEYRYDNIRVGELDNLRLTLGENELTVEGGCELAYRFREKYRVK